MLAKVGAPAEGFSTLPAVIRFLSCVNPLVLGKVGNLSVGLSTDFTLIGLLPGVNPLVACK